MLSSTAANAIGIFGSVLFITAFAYANISPAMNKVAFNLANLIGAICLLISLWVHFNLAAFVLEVAWAFIAMIGLVSALRSQA